MVGRVGPEREAARERHRFCPFLFRAFRAYGGGGRPGLVRPTQRSSRADWEDSDSESGMSDCRLAEAWRIVSQAPHSRSL